MITYPILQEKVRDELQISFKTVKYFFIDFEVEQVHPRWTPGGAKTKRIIRKATMTIV
jgi:hypothetical protein